MAERPQPTRAPLFDRLVDREPWKVREAPPRRTLDRKGLRESVRRELERLFNTRSPLPASRLAEMAPEDRTVADYGIPDPASFAPANPEDRREIAELLRRSVAAYEPRLQHVVVEARTLPDQPERLIFALGGALLIDGVPEPVTFPVVFRRGRGEVRILEHG